MSNSDPLFLLALLAGVAFSVYMAADGKTRRLAEKFVGYASDKYTESVSVVPNMWFVVDDYGVNSREWADFGARSSRELNVGFLKLTRSRCAMTQGRFFEIHNLMGRDAVADVIISKKGRLPVYHMTCPPYLWRAWARAALLNYAGGLYLDGYSLCLGPSFFDIVNGHSDLVFGTDHDERILSSKSDLGVSGPFAGWADGIGHMAWRRLSDDIADIIDAGAQSWTSAEARNQNGLWHNKHLAPNMKTVRPVEWSRRPNGQAIELEDLFDRSPPLSGIEDEEFVPPSTAIYLPLDNEKLSRSTYNWFMRMSSEQILDPESRFTWAVLAQNKGSKDSMFMKA
jgi:hypothetical protein